MFDEQFIRASKWPVVIIDLVIFYFLVGRVQPLTDQLFGDTVEIEISDHIMLGTVLSSFLVLLFFIIFVIAWCGYINEHDPAYENDTAQSAALMRKVIYLAAFSLVIVELVTTATSFLSQLNDPYAVSQPSRFDYFRDISISLFLILCHISAAYFTAHIYLMYVSRNSRTPSAGGYTPPSRTPKENLRDK